MSEHRLDVRDLSVVLARREERAALVDRLSPLPEILA